MSITYEQTLQWLKNRHATMRIPKSREAVGKAIDAVEYRIEQKPVPKNIHYSGMIVASCPTCGEELESEEYCPSCGQALKWEDYDGEA